MKRQSPSRGQTASAKLIVRAIQFSPSESWLEDETSVVPLSNALESSGLDVRSETVRSAMGASATVTSWSELAQWIRSNGDDVYEIQSRKRHAYKLKVNATQVSIGVECELPFDEDADIVRRTLTPLLEKLHAGYCERALVGPVLAIVLRNVPYTRPRPIRDDLRWPAGAVLLGRCERFVRHTRDKELGEFERLIAQPPPAGVVRRRSGDLVVLETEADQGSALADQRARLEKWVGEILKLSKDEDFNDAGDRRLLRWKPEKAGNLGVYDAPTEVLYKTAPELANDELDPDTLEALEVILQANELPDGREIRQKRVVFVNRSAALKWRAWVLERGGDVAYLGDEGELWDVSGSATPPENES